MYWLFGAFVTFASERKVVVGL